MSFSRHNGVKDVVLGQEVGHIFMKPSTSFVGDELLRNAKVAEPSPLQSFDEVRSLLRFHHRSSLILGGQVDDVDNRDLVLAQLDPHHIRLKLLVEVGSLRKGSRC